MGTTKHAKGREKLHLRSGVRSLGFDLFGEFATFVVEKRFSEEQDDYETREMTRKLQLQIKGRVNHDVGLTLSRVSQLS